MNQRFILVVTALCLAWTCSSNATAVLSAPCSAQDLLNADLIIYCKKADFLPVQRGHDVDILVTKYSLLKGSVPVGVELASPAFINFVGNDRFILFLQKQGDHFALANGSFSVIPTTSEPAPGDMQSLKSFDSYLQRELLGPARLDEFAYGALLLDGSPASLKAIWDRYKNNQPKDRNQKLILIDIGLRVKGLSALDNFILNTPVANEQSSENEGNYLFMVEADINDWIYKNTTRDNALEVLNRVQANPMFSMRTALNAVVGKLPVSDLPQIIDMLEGNADLPVRYACARIIARMLPPGSIIIPTYDTFKNDPEKYLSAWEKVAESALPLLGQKLKGK